MFRLKNQIYHYWIKYYTAITSLVNCWDLIMSELRWAACSWKYFSGNKTYVAAKHSRCRRKDGQTDRRTDGRTDGRLRWRYTSRQFDAVSVGFWYDSESFSWSQFMRGNVFMACPHTYSLEIDVPVENDSDSPPYRLRQLNISYSRYKWRRLIRRRLYFFVRKKV